MGNQQQQTIYSVPLQGTQKPGFSHIYRNPQIKNQPLPEKPQKGISTIRDIHDNTYKKFGGKPGLGKIIINKKQDQTQQRTLTHLTYKQTFQTAQKIGSALLNLQLCSDAEDKAFSNGKIMKFVGIYSKNCQQWGLCDIACGTYGITSVPLYDTLGIENLSYCLNHTKMTTCFCSSETANVLLKLKDCGRLQNLILFNLPSVQILNDLKKKFKKIMTLEELIQKGRTNIIDYHKIDIQPNDCFTFSYTSGTTGPPKGAMLSHRNFTALISSIQVNKFLLFNENDVYLSFLPLPHVMQRALTNALYYKGCFVVSYSGDNTKLKEDAQLVQPTIFVAVPKIFSRIQDAVKAKVIETGGIKKCLFDRGLFVKETKMRQNGDSNDWLYDSLVFKNTKASFGGRIRIIITGSAPIKVQTQQFIKTILAAPVVQGYGQTQNLAAAFLQNPDDHLLGHVGGIVAGLEFKLADIPQMSYFSTDTDEKGNPTPRGQIWLRGPQIFLGYYKDEAKTKQAINEEGWLRTGDVGMMLPGTKAIKIIDRKKNIFKLQQGQYIAPEKVQSVYYDSPLISEIVVHGESTHSFAVAIINPKKDSLIKFAESKGIMSSNYQELLANTKLRQQVAKQLNAIGKRQGLNGFQQAKNVWLVPKAFSEYELLTNTLKLQRFKVKKVFQSEIQKMYTQGQMKVK